MKQLPCEKRMSSLEVFILQGLERDTKIVYQHMNTVAELNAQLLLFHYQLTNQN